MLKIRLARIGGKQRPFYRVVVVEERSKRTGSYVELLGTYNPLSEPKEIKLKQDRIDYWIKQGAQPSVGYLRIIGKAKQRPPRKAKKEKKEEVVHPADSGKPVEGEDVVASADQSLSEPGEAVAAEPVAEGEASLTDQPDNVEPETTPEAESKDEGTA